MSHWDSSWFGRDHILYLASVYKYELISLNRDTVICLLCSDFVQENITLSYHGITYIIPLHKERTEYSILNPIVPETLKLQFWGLSSLHRNPKATRNVFQNACICIRDCYVCVSTKFMCASHSFWCSNIWSYNFCEVIRVRWIHENEVPSRKLVPE